MSVESSGTARSGTSATMRVSSSPTVSFMLAVGPTPPHTTSSQNHDSAKIDHSSVYNTATTPNSVGSSRSNDLMLFPPSQTISESLASLASSTATQLEKVWDEVGYTPEERASQISELLAEFRQLCDTKIEEEKAIAEQYRRTIADAKEEMRATSKALKTEIDSLLLQESGYTLTDELATLEATLEGLRIASAAATSDLTDCRDKLIAMHEALGSELSPKWMDITSDLTQSRREEFHRQVAEVEEIIESRTSAVMQILLDCQHLMKELRLDKNLDQLSDLDRKIMSSLVRTENDTIKIRSIAESDYCTGISSKTLNDLTKRVAELSNEKRRRKIKLSELGGEIALLWEKLRVREEVQRAFTESVRGLGMDTIEKGEKELKRLHELKAEMIGKLIFEARETITTLWEETNANDEQRESFRAGNVTDESLFSDSLLAEHEEYIKVLQTRLNQMRPLLKIIERRQDILKERMEYEELQKDPERLQQRGAALTKQLMREEKMSRRIKKDLPKLTDVLVKKLHEWNKENGEEFLFHGEPYLDVMKRQEEEWQTYKDNEVQMKLKKKQEEKAIETKITNGTFKPLPGKKKNIAMLHANKSRPLSDAQNRENRSKSRSRAESRSRATSRGASVSRRQTSY